MDDGDTALAAPAFGYVDFGVAHGLSREALMSAAQLREELRADPDARCSPFAYVVLWRELITRLPDVVVPVELVRAMQPAALGVTAQVVIRADNVTHAGSLIERFLKLSDTGHYSGASRKSARATRTSSTTCGPPLPVRCSASVTDRSSMSRSSWATRTSRASIARSSAGPGRRLRSGVREPD